MNNSLIIGDTSQISYYFPNSYDRISSRDIVIDDIKSNRYNRIFILFAEQRTFLDESQDFFNKINVDYTIDIIDKLKDYCNKIVIFSTSELWNNYTGCVSVDMEYNYNYTPYIKSKEILCNIINNNRDYYNNIIIIYPFNFNSPYRKEGFLFSKIFYSILNKSKISVGNININRDIIHPSIIVENAISTNIDLLIGCGELINIEYFINDMFRLSNLDFNRYVKKSKYNIGSIRSEYFSKIKYSNYKDLLELTIKDIINND